MLLHKHQFGGRNKTLFFIAQQHLSNTDECFQATVIHVKTLFGVKKVTENTETGFHNHKKCQKKKVIEMRQTRGNKLRSKNKLMHETCKTSCVKWCFPDNLFMLPCVGMATNMWKLVPGTGKEKLTAPLAKRIKLNSGDSFYRLGCFFGCLFKKGKVAE